MFGRKGGTTVCVILGITCMKVFGGLVALCNNLAVVAITLRKSGPTCKYGKVVFGVAKMDKMSSVACCKKSEGDNSGN